MAYSTIADIRELSSLFQQTATNSKLTDAIVTGRITMADMIVDNDMGGYITIPITGTVPTAIQLLSRYKTAELCLVYLYAQKREEGNGNTDIKYWQKMYADFLTIARDNVDSTGIGTFSMHSRKGILPAMGGGQYGEFLTEEDLAIIRPVV
jgi:hypothetical protein